MMPRPRTTDANADRTNIPHLLAGAVKSTERACFMLWYPVKSLTRPNAMIGQLAAAGHRGSLSDAPRHVELSHAVLVGYLSG